MKWIIKFFKWFFSDGASSHREFKEIDRIIDNDKAEKIFAEIDNDLIRQINKAEKDFKQAQLKHIPCQILYYNKRIVRTEIRKIKSFLIKGFLYEGDTIRLENGTLYHSGSWHENKHYIKYKGK